MGVLAAVVIILGVGLVAITITTESLRRRRLKAFFAREAAPLDSDVVVSTMRHLPINKYSLAVVGGTAIAVIIVWAFTGSVVLAFMLATLALGLPLGLRARAKQREQLVLRSQMGDALTSIAASMQAGSSFVRGLQEVTEEARPPIAPYLDRVLNQVEVGVSPSDAFRSMADQSRLAPAAWLAHLLRVQETTGSPLVAMLQRLAAHVQQSDGLKREVRALTAEGRMSAYVIAALPLGLVILLEVTDPGYLDVFAEGWGIVFALGMIASICFGLFIVTRMVHSLEV